MYETKIILDSVSPLGARLVTFQITLPRIVLAEFNTHRMFSRNSASSRAIPPGKQIERVRRDPFVPRYFGKNQKGMQAEAELEGLERHAAETAWHRALNNAIESALEFQKLELHKQLANRVLETFAWQTIVCSATEYENYFGLRDNPQAAPEIRDSAHESQELYRAHIPTPLKDGEFHLPYVTGYDRKELEASGHTIEDLCYISTGRCAAVSYLNQEKIADPDADMERAKSRLFPSGHMSPFEHPAESLAADRWLHIAQEQAHEWIYNRVPVGNFWGWLQLRKTMPLEYNFKKILEARLAQEAAPAGV